MKNNFMFLVLCLFLLSEVNYAQTGIGTIMPDASAVLDVSSSTKGFLPPRLTTIQRDQISSPAIGLIIYNITSNCLEWFNGNTWYNGCGNTNISLTSNGSAVVSAYSCSTVSAGILITGITVTDVTQTITATVTKAGTYSISTTANGITFAASGTFAGTGSQNIVLTATGTPIALGSNSFTLNTAPNCNFSRTTIDNSSNGTGIVSDYSCSTASAGILNAGIAVTGVTQSITANVTKVGTYSISTTANGVTFAASGTFAGLGAQNIVLVATGIPTVTGSNSFTLNTTPNCNFSRTTIEISSNGTSVLSDYFCSTASAGILNAGISVSGVTQTITANVTSLGTYNISSTANGVTFAASGTFAGTGAQNIVLTAIGTPTSAGTNSFKLNTTPNCNFSRNTIDNSSNGTGVVSAYSCSAASSGLLNVGTAVMGVTQSITATVTSVGTYNISTTANGITFAASGTFIGTGAQNIVLTATGTPTTVGNNSFTLNTTPNCNFSRSVNPIVLPSNITLSNVTPYFIASVYDRDYIPYSAPTVAASLTVPVAADGINEAQIIDIQGTLTTTDISINIPYTVVTAPVNLPAFSQTINIPAAYTQDGISRDVVFSYSAGTYDVGSGNILATLKVLNGTLNVKKLDIQSGIGNDHLGWLLAQFNYSTNNSGGCANLQIRAIAAIPDRNIADANHVMLYLPITGADGRVWLNNNLGADYSNTAKASFNLAQQSITYNDYHACGSVYQWGRYSDGHELINWTSATTRTPVNGTTSTLSTTDTPANALFITNTSNPDNADWRNPQNDGLWQGVTGTNNPCPIGYRLPTITELNNLMTAAGIVDKFTANSSTLKFTSTGFRAGTASSGSISNAGNFSTIWSSSVDVGYSSFIFITNIVSEGSFPRVIGMPVRCIKD